MGDWKIRNMGGTDAPHAVTKLVVHNTPWIKESSDPPLNRSQLILFATLKE